jgi:pyroglutamyl-peptidase
MAATRTILLTWFQPFPGRPVNVTTTYAPTLAALAKRAFPDVTVHTAILPTEWVAGPREVIGLLARLQPGIALHFGIAGRARGFEIETVARNRRKILPDALRAEPTDRRVDLQGPDRHRVDLPVGDMVARLRRRGIPARRSQDAGGYICNAVLYHGLACAPALDCRLGFVHLPADLTPDGSARNGLQGTSPLTWDDALTGGLEILASAMGRRLPPTGPWSRTAHRPRPRAPHATGSASRSSRP